MTANNNFQLKIITGMSGAGKTQVVQNFEDLGYFCVDNLPPNLFEKFYELAKQSSGELENIVLVADVRSRTFFAELIEVLKKMRSANLNFDIIFLEARDEVLVRRFKETRRKHPLAKTGSVLSGIQEERKRLLAIRGMADIVIDTSDLKNAELKERITDIAQNESGHINLSVSIFSFGFKYGIPIDSDLVMDVRFLPNPYYIEEMRPLTGMDAPVRDYVLSFDVTQNFLQKYSELLIEILPQYMKEGKRHLAVGIGCTGGQHRSVAIANELSRLLIEAQAKNDVLNGVDINVEHRDAEKSRIGVKYQHTND